MDFNENLEGNSFTDTKDWKPMLSEWNAYAGEEFVKYLSHLGAIPEVDLNNDDDNNEGEVKKSRKKGGKKDDYPLEVDTYGLPVIPDVEDLSLERLCSQQSKASVPWASVRKAPGDFILAKYLPTGMKMDDPSKIRLAEADRLLVFWRQRQKDKIRPTFEFKAWEGDDKTMKEPVDTTSSKDSDTGPRVPVKKSTGKLRRRVEQDTSDEDQEDKDDKEDKEDKEGDEEDVVQSPPSKSKPAKKQGRASLVQFESHPRPPVKNSMPVPSPPSKSKSTKKHGRVGPVQSNSEEDSRPPVKKSKLTGGGNGRCPGQDAKQEGTGAQTDPTFPSKGHRQENQRT
ncbi:uncharacterized protein F5147DRAFT_762008 [Suillus discolor]|uniref:Uncharacterized protein n=1 Tax=Suillus discolor TaxID=1912936 RepID=A0A9P7F557_9AGAM|nr:uncharacterized protein F5147DRAFT_762008 [Suillus discolor]KAG2105109.1 hypothetical protein F5147DRAFT_762008 [Suillus discolor]